MTKSNKMLIVKIILLIFLTLIAVYCFMIKLPKPLRQYDTELHAIFFFSAAAFINILFLVKSMRDHLLIFGMLFLFGSLIEYAQEFSNTLVRKRIHGNFDPHDLKYDLIGLSVFSVFYFFYYIIQKIK